MFHKGLNDGADRCPGHQKLSPCHRVWHLHGDDKRTPARSWQQRNRAAGNTKNADTANPENAFPVRLCRQWWTRSDSNRRPPQCECGALPAALLAHSSAYWRNSFIIAHPSPQCNAENCTNSHDFINCIPQKRKILKSTALPTPFRIRDI